MNSRGFVQAALLAVVLLFAAAMALPGQELEKNDRGKFRLELSLGWQSLDPADLNSAVDADTRVQFLRYDHYLQALQDSGQIRSWSATAESGRRRITSGWQLEPRLRYRLGASFSLSAAVRVQRGGGSQNLLFEFTRVLDADDRYVETLAFIPYRLSVQSVWPSIGIHFRRPIARRIHAAGHVAAGPLLPTSPIVRPGPTPGTCVVQDIAGPYSATPAKDRKRVRERASVWNWRPGSNGLWATGWRFFRRAVTSGRR